MSAAPRRAAVAEFHYRVDAPARGHFPGHHRSTRGDSGFEFRAHVPLLDAPDARRLDLLASLRDPFGGWIVRTYTQRKSVPVVMVADLSASMGVRGVRRRLDVVADFAESLAWSAWRAGDSFGFVGCDTAVRADLRVAQSRARGVGGPLSQALRALEPHGAHARGLLEAHRHLPRQRALVFLVSDFHLPLADVAALLASFGHHQLVPVVVDDPAELAPATPRGLAQLVDPETGRERLVWWRPALRERWQALQHERRSALRRLFRARRAEALYIEREFRAEAVTRHFHR